MAQRLGEVVTMRSCGQVRDCCKRRQVYVAERRGMEVVMAISNPSGGKAARLGLKGVTTISLNA